MAHKHLRQASIYINLVNKGLTRLDDLTMNAKHSLDVVEFED